MNNQEKTVRRVIDQNLKHVDDSGLKPAPALDKTKRRTSEQMMWHLRHRPYGIGGGADADTG